MKSKKQIKRKIKRLEKEREERKLFKVFDEIYAIDKELIVLKWVLK